MKTFEIDEKQLQEIAGRLNLMSGLSNIPHIAGILADLEAVVKPKAEPDNSNVINMPDKEHA